jgi:hypothetical protein
MERLGLAGTRRKVVGQIRHRAASHGGQILAEAVIAVLYIR